MEFIFLKEDIESILLFVTAPIYFTIIAILQSKNLKIIDKIRRNTNKQKEQSALVYRLRKLKNLTPFLLLLGLLIHVLIYFMFANDVIRTGYFLSIAIMYFIYLLIAMINFWLKGAGVLKDIKHFNGLPGN